MGWWARLQACRRASIMKTVVFCLVFGVGLLGTSIVIQANKVSAQAQRTLTVCSRGCTHSTIASAIGAAAPRDIVLVSPGTYTSGITLNKAITLASRFYTGDKAAINTTTLRGLRRGAGAPVVPIITVTAPGARVIGFTLRGGARGIQNMAGADAVEVADNRFINVGTEAAPGQQGDALDWEGTGGVVSRNYFERPGDDCIDLDGPKSGVVADNTCLSSDNDGLEVKLEDYVGPMRRIVIRNNTFVGARGDGIQLIDFPKTSSYTFHIERNLLANNAKAGVGIMDSGETKEDLRAASIPERVHVINNTIAGNAIGLTGGDNSAVINNILLNNKIAGMKGVDGGSVASYNLFFGNPTAHITSNVVAATTKAANPKVDAQYRLQPGSPAIDAGTAKFTFKNQQILNYTPRSFAGPAPDLGRYERD